jgi:hypothetical protein
MSRTIKTASRRARYRSLARGASLALLLLALAACEKKTAQKGPPPRNVTVAKVVSS